MWEDSLAINEPQIGIQERHRVRIEQRELQGATLTSRNGHRFVAFQGISYTEPQLETSGSRTLCHQNRGQACGTPAYQAACECNARG
jgi:hypothetical protein